jgi:hypothetical protein
MLVARMDLAQPRRPSRTAKMRGVVSFSSVSSGRSFRASSLPKMPDLSLGPLGAAASGEWEVSSVIAGGGMI